MDINQPSVLAKHPKSRTIAPKKKAKVADNPPDPEFKLNGGKINGDQVELADRIESEVLLLSSQDLPSDLQSSNDGDNVQSANLDRKRTSSQPPIEQASRKEAGTEDQEMSPAH
jgi:hypothetical protein